MTDRTGLASLVPITPMSQMPFWRNTILLYGAPKIGKTTEASKFPNAIFFDAEQGTVGIDVPTFENLMPATAQYPNGRDRITSPIAIWEDVLVATSILETTKGKNIDGVVVIDTGQASYDMCREYVKRVQGWEHESDVGFGKAWKAVKNEYTSWIARIKALGFGIVFIGHATTEIIEEPSRKYEKTKPRMDSGPLAIIEPFVNIIMYAETQHIMGRDCRVVHTKPSTKVSAGERGKVTRLQPLLPFDYDAINRNWNGEVIDLNAWFGFTPPTNEATAATPENVTPPVNNPDPGVAAVAREFDATLTN